MIFSVQFGLNNHRRRGVAMLVSGFVCAFHHATLGLNPKHIIYAFFNLNFNLSCDVLKRRK